MPTAAPKPCTQCGVLVRDGSGRCEAHKVRAGTFADRARGTRHQRGYDSAWDKRRERVMQRDAGICQPCLRHGIVHPGQAVDHIVPREQGGTEDDGNLQCICKPVHQAKTAVEKRGRAWDEQAWFAQQRPATASPAASPGPRAQPRPADRGEGGQMSGAPAARTDRFVEFLRAQVSGEGGVNAAPVVQAPAAGAVDQVEVV